MNKFFLLKKKQLAKNNIFFYQSKNLFTTFELEIFNNNKKVCPNWVLSKISSATQCWKKKCFFWSEQFDFFFFFLPTTRKNNVCSGKKCEKNKLSWGKLCIVKKNQKKTKMFGFEVWMLKLKFFCFFVFQGTFFLWVCGPSNNIEICTLIFFFVWVKRISRKNSNNFVKKNSFLFTTIYSVFLFLSPQIQVLKLFGTDMLVNKAQA